jgi:hypothetical protein
MLPGTLYPFDLPTINYPEASRVASSTQQVPCPRRFNRGVYRRGLCHLPFMVPPL